MLFTVKNNPTTTLHSVVRQFLVRMNDTYTISSKSLIESLALSITQNSGDVFPHLGLNLATYPFRLYVMVLVTTITILFYRYIVFPIYFSPLARIPCVHPLAAVTPLWMDWKRYTNEDVETICAGFKKYGPFIRLGPSEIAVNTASDIATVYGFGLENFDKASWYDFFTNHGYARVLVAEKTWSLMEAENEIRSLRLGRTTRRGVKESAPYMQNRTCSALAMCKQFSQNCCVDAFCQCYGMHLSVAAP